ncbi:thioredoxin-like protein [Catenaria anguillulae PL171]|uniref:Thioredoxin-like protein n=1 Tax=Catenaria anguillulae PL171 TaxID=765915 RepID=A0A1Y2I163_9FUNG|nr:thioredoxin-like protein [Catenaria anguillulae PL171]
MTDLDERLIKAIRAANDTDGLTLEPRALGEPDSDHDHNHQDDVAASCCPPSMAMMDPAMQRTSGPQTGPKGVLADYKHAQRIKQQQQQAKHKAYWDKINRSALSSTRPVLDEKMANDDDELDDDELLNQLDVDLADRYAAMRLDQIRQANQLPTFGTYREIGVTQFLKEVDEEHVGVSVIIHLYEPYITECQLLNKHLTALAPKFAHAKFLRMRASSSPSTNLDPVALPVLQVYRGGNLVSNLVRISDDMQELANSREYSADECETVLKAHGVLRDGDEADGGGGAGSTQESAYQMRRLRGLEIGHGCTQSDEDSEDD